MTLSSGTSVVTSCASVSERIHSSSSNCFVVGSFSVFRKHQWCVEQEAALFRQVSWHPLDCENVELPKRGRRLLWPAPAKETRASKCSCRSPVGPGALTGANLTCGSDARPVLLRPCSPHRAPQEQQTHDRCRRHTKPTLPTGAHSC